MFGAQYQWIVVGGWSLGRRDSGCTSDSLLTASNGTIRLQIRHVRNKKIPEDVQEDTLRQLIQEDSELTRLAAFAYDAVWVAAKAVSQVMEMVTHREKYHSQRSTSLAQEEINKMLLEALKHTNFEGLTVSKCITLLTHTRNKPATNLLHTRNTPVSHLEHCVVVLSSVIFNIYFWVQ